MPWVSIYFDKTFNTIIQILTISFNFEVVKGLSVRVMMVCDEELFNLFFVLLVFLVRLM